MEISQLAQHFGAECSYQRIHFNGEWRTESDEVNVSLLSDLATFPDQFKDVKLNLRSLCSLTNEEVLELVRLSGRDPEEYSIIKKSDEWVSCNQYDWGHSILDIDVKTGEITREVDRGEHFEPDSFNLIPLYVYLHRKHFYIPGFIDEEIIELIKP